MSEDKAILEQWISDGRHELEAVGEQYDQEWEESNLAFYNWCVENNRLGLDHAA